MKGPTGHDHELQLIGALCRELAKLGLNVGMSDARPAVVIRTGLVNPPLWITLDASGEFFEWRNAEDQYPVADPVSAAARLAEFIKTRDFGSGEDK